jgi:hypothetical protein
LATNLDLGAETWLYKGESLDDRRPVLSAELAKGAMLHP